MIARPSLSFAFVVALAACGGKTGDEAAGNDAASDAPDDATRSDSSPLPDGADSAPVDSPTSDASDATSDAPTVEPPGVVGCGSAGSCDIATHVCCYKSDGPETGTVSCVAGSKCPGPYDDAVRCEKSSDCPSGQLCCAGITLNSNLTASCMADCGTAMQRCATSAECTGGTVCNVRSCNKYSLWVCGAPTPWCS